MRLALPFKPALINFTGIVRNKMYQKVTKWIFNTIEHTSAFSYTMDCAGQHAYNSIIMSIYHIHTLHTCPQAHIHTHTAKENTTSTAMLKKCIYLV